MSPPDVDDPLPRLGANLAEVHRRVEDARHRGPHAADAVELVVVTKSQPAGIFGPLAAAGVRQIGENRIQSAAARRPGSPAELTWHGIGHLQRNKASLAVDTFDVFHALDSLRLANRLEAVLAERERTWPVYVQINAAEDPAKGGWHPDEALQALEAVAALPHLTPIGFMTMGALVSQESDLRRTFRTLRDVRDESVRRGIGSTPPRGLSMGMSSDYEIAVEEGATCIRVGRALFAGVSISEDPPTGVVRSPDGREPS